ncbi:MAG: hypothetical protein IKM94_00065 [Alphaproteobacteria bacterium]|nr:hypothetical protein [Alphaproteobacteria bacterium]
MTNIPDTEYITVKRDKDGQVGVFVGGNPATTYHGEKICNIDYVKEVFAWMQEQNPEIEEFHIGAFKTRGEHAKPGNPNGVFGPNAWCRVKFKNGKLGAWVFYDTASLAANCAHNCANYCARYVRGDASFRSAVLGAVIDNQGTKQKQPSVIKLSWQITTIAGHDKQK